MYQLRLWYVIPNTYHVVHRLPARLPLWLWAATSNRSPCGGGYFILGSPVPYPLSVGSRGESWIPECWAPVSAWTRLINPSPGLSGSGEPWIPECWASALSAVTRFSDARLSFALLRLHLAGSKGSEGYFSEDPHHPNSYLHESILGSWTLQSIHIQN